MIQALAYIDVAIATAFYTLGIYMLGCMIVESFITENE